MLQDTLSRPTPAGQDAIAQPVDVQSLPTSVSTSRQAVSQPLAIQVSATEPPDAARIPPVDDPQSPLSRSTIHSSVLGSPAAVNPAPQPTPLMDRALGRARRSIAQTARLFFSAEGKELRHVTGIFFRLGFSMVQVVVIVVLLALASSKFKSKNQEPWDTNVSEFEDCDKLGIWNALWAVRASFGCGMIIWEWKRYIAKRERALRRRTADIELEDSTDQHLQWGTEVRGPPENPTIPRAPVSVPDPAILHSSQNRGAEPSRFSGSPLPPDTAPPSDPAPRRAPRREPRPVPTPGDALFDRMDTFLTATGLIHFVVNHIWLYTTVNTCRINDPHIWYLGLGIASLGYLIVLELLLIAFIVFVLGPILLLILNLIMLCLGRPVDRHGNVIVRPEIPRMEQSLIEKIPLVVYIPPKEPETKPQEKSDGASEPRESSRKDSGNPADAAGLGEASVTSQTRGGSNATASRSARNRFAWLRRHGEKNKAPNLTLWSDAKLVEEGDQRFEKSEHPFVVLESNRAMCYICLGEFVEPKRKDGVATAPPRSETPEPVTAAVEGPSATPHVEGSDEIEQAPASSDVTPSKGKGKIQETADEASPEADEESGTPGEPLRLLACGHVFHKHCLDPWLSKTSGRCPVCNRKVEIPEHMR
ncbi:hypothetical protein FS837_001705 [Tulasnella sp. UAMH 9824]|nr:hypothetical protein FS837_001705 [Tulasnella sp. UAMH 9824]